MGGLTTEGGSDPLPRVHVPHEAATVDTGARATDQGPQGGTMSGKDVASFGCFGVRLRHRALRAVRRRRGSRHPAGTGRHRDRRSVPPLTRRPPHALKTTMDSPSESDDDIFDEDDDGFRRDRERTGCRRRGPTPAPQNWSSLFDGVRMNLDGFLAEYLDEISPGYCGLTSTNAWELLAAIRAEAARLADRIVAHHQAGATPTQIADLLDASKETAWDELIEHLVRSGVLNRGLARILGTRASKPSGVSYKAVERRRKTLRCSPRHLAGRASPAAV